MDMKEELIEVQSSVGKKEATPEALGTGEDRRADQKYRILTEDEILGINRQRIVWSDRMHEESNFLYKLKYSRGKISQTFIEGVIESLEESGDFQITSFGHSKFNLFVAGNRELTEKIISRSFPQLLNYLHIRGLERLSKNFEEVQCQGEGNSYLTPGSGNGRLSNFVKVTLTASVKPNIFFFMKTWGRE